MNDIDPSTPNLSHQANANAVTPPPLDPNALGADPTEREPIPNALGAAEAILRQPRRVLFNLVHGDRAATILKLVGIALFGALAYGLVVGMFSRGTQLWAAPVKVAGGLFVSGMICLPSLYIFSCLGGAQAKLSEVCGLVAGLLALMTVMLIGFAPVAWVFSESTESVTAMGVLHLLFWAIATGFALRFLYNGFELLRAEVGAGLRVWTAIFVLVMLQMTTALRPLLGTSDTFLPIEKKFFVSHWGDQMHNQTHGKVEGRW